MSKKNYYAVRLKNGKSTITKTWGECKAFVARCPSNAIYKGFITEWEAQEFLDALSGGKEPASGDHQTLSSGKENSCIAYVDGSYNADTAIWGYGVVLYPELEPDIKFELSGAGHTNHTARNVAGEVKGAMEAVSLAIEKGFTHITICHDYQGISAWVEGMREAKAPVSKEYFEVMSKYKDKIEISFRKVAAHTGVELNERADQLAGEACGLR